MHGYIKLLLKNYDNPDLLWTYDLKLIPGYNNRN